MKASPAVAAPTTKTSFLRDAKKGREFERGRAVRVVSETGFFVARLNSTREAEQIRRLLAAPNAVPILQHDGALVGIRLMSVADDQGNAGEQHGSSICTTERVRNDGGQYVGSDMNLKHKNSCNTWGRSAT